MGKSMDEAHSALTQAANNMAQFYDAHHRETLLYKIGDKVWLNGQNIMMTGHKETGSQVLSHI